MWWSWNRSVSDGISIGCWFPEGLGHVVVPSRVRNDERSDEESICACVFADDWQSVSGGKRDRRSISGFALASDVSAVNR